MSAQLLRKKYTRRFAGMEKYARAAAWLIVGTYIAQAVAAGALGAWLLSLPSNGWAVAGIVLCMIFIGTRMRGLNNIIHECSHSTFSSHRGDNASIGRICAAMLFNSFSDYRDEHLSHHAHLGDYDHDLDLQGIQDLKLHDPLSTSVVLRHLVTPFIGRHLPYYLNLNMSVRDGQVYRYAKYAILAVVALFTFFFPLTGLLFVIAPFVFIYSALNYWADCLDHAGIVASDDDLDASRNLLAPGAIRWLFFPRNDCYHLVHHLFPHVPARHLGKTHETLARDTLYRSRPNAVRSPVDADEADVAIPAE